jgi:hypothetical protein
MLNVRRNHPKAFSSLGLSCLFFISFYPLVLNLLDVGNGVCFLEHTMVNHMCRNRSLGLATKARLQSCGPKESPGVKESVGE